MWTWKEKKGRPVKIAPTGTKYLASQTWIVKILPVRTVQHTERVKDYSQNGNSKLVAMTKQMLSPCALQANEQSSKDHQAITTCSWRWIEISLSPTLSGSINCGDCQSVLRAVETCISYKATIHYQGNGSYGHINESLVSAPVVGFVPFTSSRWHRRANVLDGNCASVKSAFSKSFASITLLEKYAPLAIVFLSDASSMLVSSNDAPRKSAPEKSARTKLNDEDDND